MLSKHNSAQLYAEVPEGGGGNGTDTPQSRAGAVVELLVWARDAHNLSQEAARTLMHACVETGAAGAAESLTRELPFLSEPLVRAHAEIGNHRAARRVALTTGSTTAAADEEDAAAAGVRVFDDEHLTTFFDLELEALSDVFEGRSNLDSEEDRLDGGGGGDGGAGDWLSVGERTTIIGTVGTAGAGRRMDGGVHDGKGTGSSVIDSSRRGEEEEEHGGVIAGKQEERKDEEEADATSSAAATTTTMTTTTTKNNSDEPAALHASASPSDTGAGAPVHREAKNDGSTATNMYRRGGVNNNNNDMLVKRSAAVNRVLFGGEPSASPPPLSELLGPRRTLLVDSREKLTQARAWLEAATLIDRGGGGGASSTSTSSSLSSSSSSSSSSTHRSVIGMDCEWQPGPGSRSTGGVTRPNPVALVQLAAGVAEAHEGGCRAVLLDCVALLGAAADDATAAATADFLAWVFATAVVVGFGVASDVKRLLTSYPQRLAPVAVAAAELAAARDKAAASAASVVSSAAAAAGVRTVCVRDVALSRGVDAASAASLASLCRTLLDGRELDKSQQKSEWGARPLTGAQIRYAALDALVPAMILRRLLATHPSAAVLGTSNGGGCGAGGGAGGGKDDAGTGGAGGGGAGEKKKRRVRDRLTLNIGAAAQPWTRVERFAGSLDALCTTTDDGDDEAPPGRGGVVVGSGVILPAPRTVDDVRAALEAGAHSLFTHVFARLEASPR